MVTPSGSRRLSFLGQSPAKALTLKGAKILVALEISNDWEKRVNALESLTDFVSSGGHNAQQRTDFLRELRNPLKANVLDRQDSFSFFISPYIQHKGVLVFTRLTSSSKT